MSESLQPFESRREALAEKLGLKAQWELQVKALNEAGVLEILPESEDLGIVGIDGKEYPMPTFQEIVDRITPEKAEILEHKLEQGFSKLLLIPFAMPLDLLIERYKKLLLEKHRRGKFFSTAGKPLPLDPDNPLYKDECYNQADVNGTLVYYPKQLDQRNHQGQTKQELIDQGNPWEVILTPDLPDLPAQDKIQTIAGRTQLDANHSSREYLNTLQTNPNYQHEQGFTPESWLSYAMTELQQKDQQIDDWQGLGKACWNFGSYFPAGPSVSHCNFNRGGQRAGLGGRSPDYGNGYDSARSLVKI